MTSLSTPLQLGRLTLANRVVMAPMTRNRAGADGVPTALMGEYYAQRASAGLIVTEATSPSPDGYAAPCTPGVHRLDQAHGWSAVVDAVHDAGGRVAIQLCHAGRATHPETISGLAPVGPRAVAARVEVFTPSGPRWAAVPARLDTSGRRRVQTEFVLAASTAIAVGADFVEVHAGNGFLLNQFLDSAANPAGGRWPAEVLAAVCAAIGPQRVGVRISPGGVYNDMHDAAASETLAQFVDAVDELGIAYLHVIERPDAGPSAIDACRSSFGGVLIANGPMGAAERDLARVQLVRADRADAVSFGRAFIANPDLPARLHDGTPLTMSDDATYYAGAARGYVDYPSGLPALQRST